MLLCLNSYQGVATRLHGFLLHFCSVLIDNSLLSHKAFTAHYTWTFTAFTLRLQCVVDTECHSFSVQMLLTTKHFHNKLCAHPWNSFCLVEETPLYPYSFSIQVSFGCRLKYRWQNCRDYNEKTKEKTKEKNFSCNILSDMLYKNHIIIYLNI